MSYPRVRACFLCDIVPTYVLINPEGTIIYRNSGLGIYSSVSLEKFTRVAEIALRGAGF